LHHPFYLHICYSTLKCVYCLFIML